MIQHCHNHTVIGLLRIEGLGVAVAATAIYHHAGGGWGMNWPQILMGSLIWVAHIGIDRLFGLGLKYATGFRHTHLGYQEGKKMVRHLT